MTTALGWAAAGALAIAVLRLRRRLALIAEAAHELRGPAAAISFAVATLRREPAGPRRALRFESELERMRAALADLDAARTGRRAPARARTLPLEHVLRGAAEGWRAAAGEPGRGIDIRWDAGRAFVHADRGRLAQALGNLLANAVEHGSGPIRVRAVRHGRRSVRVEVRNGASATRPGRRRSVPDRGRGLGIAARAAREAGGRLDLRRSPDGTTAVLDLPLADGGERGGAGPTRPPMPRAEADRRPQARHQP